MAEAWNITLVSLGAFSVFEEPFDPDDFIGQIPNASTIAVPNMTRQRQILLEFTQMSANSRNCVIAYLFLFAIAATGNFSVFFSVLQQLRRTKSRISIFILHLSLADLLVTFGIIPLEVVWRITVQWYGGNLLCKVCKFFSAFGLYLSSFVLICISLDRYFVIIHPLKVANARRRGRVMLLSAWITATLCSLPQAFIFHVASPKEYPSVQQCVSFGFFTSAGEELAYNVFSVSFMFFIPLLVVIYTYVMIISKITRKSRQHSQSKKTPEGQASGRILLRRSDPSNHMERARNRTLKLTCIIVTVFVVCSTPYVVMTLWYMFDRESAAKVDPQIQDALFLMVVSNSCLNPLVYGTFTRECRQSLTNCFGFTDTRMVTCDQRLVRSRRRGDCGGGRGLRRQSQLKMLYTTAKRPTSKEVLESFNNIAINPTRIPSQYQQDPPKALSYGIPYGTSSVPTSMATLNTCASPSSPKNNGNPKFFRDSNGSLRKSIRRNHSNHRYPPPRSASLNPTNFQGTYPEIKPQCEIFIQEETEVQSGHQESPVPTFTDVENHNAEIKILELPYECVPVNKNYSVSLSTSKVLCKIENSKANCIPLA